MDYSTKSNKFRLLFCHQRRFIKKAVLKNIAIFTEKHLRWSLFLIKLQESKPATLLKRDSNTGCEIFLKTLILKIIYERLPLSL